MASQSIAVKGNPPQMVNQSIPHTPYKSLINPICDEKRM